VFDIVYRINGILLFLEKFRFHINVCCGLYIKTALTDFAKLFAKLICFVLIEFFLAKSMNEWKSLFW